MKKDREYEHTAMEESFINPTYGTEHCMGVVNETAKEWERIQAEFARRLAKHSARMLGSVWFPGRSRERKIREAAFELHLAIDWYVRHVRQVRNEVAKMDEKREGE